MAQIYIVNKAGPSQPLKRIYCKNEEIELQAALERNFDLLPGDQISPDDPCQWLLIRREMPVPDPGTGLNRWNIDFLNSQMERSEVLLVEARQYQLGDQRIISPVLIGVSLRE